MSRTVVEGTARLRLAFALAMGAAVALLLHALLATQVEAPPAVVLAGLAVLVAAAIGLRSSHHASAPRRAPVPPRGADHEAVSFLAERVTDTLRHPLRPRAPGLV